MQKRNLDIGYSIWGDEDSSARGTTIGVDPTPLGPPWSDIPSFPQIIALAENLPFASNSLDRVTSGNAVGTYSDFEESIEEIVRVLKPGGTASIKLDVSGDLPRKDIREIIKGLPILNFRIRTLYKEEGPDPQEWVAITFRKVEL